MTSTSITEVPLDALELDRFEPLIGEHRMRELNATTDRARRLMEGRTFWNLNSTPEGGGVAEMLASQLPYARGAGIDARWLVIEGDDDFFQVSKRIHNQLHGNPGDDEDLGVEARRTYERTLAPNEDDLTRLLHPGDVVLLHDPQTAGLIVTAKASGAAVVWRCHVGVDEPNDYAQSAWDFLLPYVSEADRTIFTCRHHVWAGIDDERVMIVPPSIDAFTPKNQELGDATIDAILAAACVVDGDLGRGEPPAYVARNGDTCVVTRKASVEPGPVPAGAPMVVQVSRWDSLKDPVGVLRGFVGDIDSFRDAHLVLAGPTTDGVTDDPEQLDTLNDVRAAWNDLDPDVRSRVHLVSLPMDDEDENAAIVNALQRRATVVVQKSLAEGFGLTVAEAMWKKRPVVASARGGITEQITDGETGILVQDPENPSELGLALRRLFADPEGAAQLGDAAHDHVREHFLAPREIRQHFELLAQLIDEAPV